MFGGKSGVPKPMYHSWSGESLVSTQLVFSPLTWESRQSERGPRAQDRNGLGVLKVSIALPFSTASICDLGGASPPVAAHASVFLAYKGCRINRTEISKITKSGR